MGAAAGNKAAGRRGGRRACGHSARAGLTRACRSSCEWRLEPFSRCTIRAMVRESPLSGSSIAAPLPAGGLRTGPRSPPHPAPLSGVTGQRRRRGCSSAAASGWKAPPHRNVPQRPWGPERGSASSAARCGVEPRGPSELGPGGLCPEPGRRLGGVSNRRFTPGTRRPSCARHGPDKGHLKLW